MLIRNPRIEEAPLQGELMLFNPESSQFYVLNSTMAFIWRHCDKAGSTEAMLSSMEAEFQSVDRAAAGDDLDRAVAELRNLGLLIDAPAATS